MPKLITTTTSYQKLDDRIYLICNHCGNSIKSPPGSWWKMTSVNPGSSRSQPIFRVSSPKHFLTWSATAANNKIQKLSKHLAQNVSKLQVRVDRVLHGPVISPANNSEPVAAQRVPTAHAPRTPTNSLQDAQEHQHLLSVNNVHVAVVHNLKGQIPKRNNIEAKVNNLSCPSLTPPPRISNAWKVSCRSRQKCDFELERKDITKSLDIFELKPLRSTEFLENDTNPLEHRGEQCQIGRSSSSSNNDTKGSGDSVGGSTAAALSPHWSRASSWTSNGDPVNPLDDLDSPPPLQHEDPRLTAVSRSCVQVNVADLSNLLSPAESSSSIVENQSDLSIEQVLEEEPELRSMPWFHAGIPREIALEVLKNEVLGSFIVRESSTRSGCFALSVRVPQEFQPSGIAHYLIIRNKGYKIKGFTKEFGSLTSLITHHSVMPELLPCTLYRPLPTPSRVSRANSADFVEPEKLLTLTPQKAQQGEWRITEF